MAGDTYSFIIEEFQEKNCGRYTIIAENQHGKATCSAEIVLEGSEFTTTSNSYEGESATGNSKTAFSQETTHRRIGSMDQTSTVKTVSTESRGVETMPLVMHDLSTQSMLPQMRDMSSQSQRNITRGIIILLKTS